VVEGEAEDEADPESLKLCETEPVGEIVLVIPVGNVV